MRQILGLLAALGVAVTLAGCNSDGATDLSSDFSSRFEQPSMGPTSCPVTAIHFQDRTTGGPTAWEWTFGDGSTSTEQNPTWETNAVVAEVTLIAKAERRRGLGHEDDLHPRVLIATFRGGVRVVAKRSSVAQVGG